MGRGEFDKDSWVIEGFGRFGGTNVACGAAAEDPGEEFGFGVAFPIFARLVVGGIDD